MADNTQCAVRFRLADVLRGVEFSKCKNCKKVWLGKISNGHCPVCHVGVIVTLKHPNQSETSALTKISRQALIKLYRVPQAVQMETLGKLWCGLKISPKDLFEIGGPDD